MNQLNFIFQEIGRCIHYLCNQYQINLQGHLYLRVDNEEVNLPLLQLDYNKSKRKLGTFMIYSFIAYSDVGIVYIFVFC